MFKTPLLLVLIVSAIPILGCGEDDPVEEPTPICYFDCGPNNGERVLANLEASYNRKNIAELDKLLDPNFVFFFAPADVGGNVPSQWGRAEEMFMTRRLFDQNPNQPGTWSIDVDLKFDPAIQWVDVIPAAFPDEVWYMATVPYEFSAQFESREAWITSSGAQAQFTVRNTGTSADPLWKLVEWRDLDVKNEPPTAFQIRKTWGGFKAGFIPAFASP